MSQENKSKLSNWTLEFLEHHAKTMINAKADEANKPKDNKKPDEAVIYAPGRPLKLQHSLEVGAALTLTSSSMKGRKL